MSEVAVKKIATESDLPEGWELIKLAALLEKLETGKRPKGGVQKIKSGIPSLGGEHLDADGVFKFEKIKFVPKDFAESMQKGHIAVGDILVVKDGATTAKTSIVRDSFPFDFAVINEHVFLCRCKDEVDPKYVFYYLWSSQGQQQILSDFRGAAQGGISKGFAELVEIPIAPLDQQKVIVAEIEKQFSRLDEAVGSLKRVKANLKHYKAAVLKAAVEGKLTEEWRKQNPDVEPGNKLLDRILAERRTKWEEAELAKMKTKGKEPKNDKWKSRYKIPQSPEDVTSKLGIGSWAFASAAQISEHIVDGTHHTPTYIDKGVDFISAKDIKGWAIDFSQCRKIPQEEHNELINRCHPKPGHVLVTKSGTIGRVAVVKTERPFSLFESVALIPRLAGIDPDYLAYVVHSEVMGEFGRRSQKGVAVRHLHLEDLRLLPIPIPPADEQKAIVSLVDRELTIIEGQDIEIDRALGRARQLRQAVLASVFSGLASLDVVGE